MEIVEYRGVEGLVYSKVIQDDAEGYVTGEVKELAPVSQVEKTVEASSETHYYDNIPGVVIDSTGADTINCNVSAIPLDVLADITGQYYDADTGALVEGDRQTEYYALGYKTKKTNGKEVYVWRYKGKFGIPATVHVTEDNGTTANGQQLTYTGISTSHKFKKPNRRAKGIVVDLEKDLAKVDEFFANVTTPDTLKVKE